MYVNITKMKIETREPRPGTKYIDWWLWPDKDLAKIILEYRKPRRSIFNKDKTDEDLIDEIQDRTINFLLTKEEVEFAMNFINSNEGFSPGFFDGSRIVRLFSDCIIIYNNEFNDRLEPLYCYLPMKDERIVGPLNQILAGTTSHFEWNKEAMQKLRKDYFPNIQIKYYGEAEALIKEHVPKDITARQVNIAKNYSDGNRVSLTYSLDGWTKDKSKPSFYWEIIVYKDKDGNEINSRFGYEMNGEFHPTGRAYNGGIIWHENMEKDGSGRYSVHT